MDSYTYKLQEKKLNRYTFSVEIGKELYTQKRDEVYKRLSKKVKIAGFRPGMAPKSLTDQKVALDVLVETTNELLPQVTTEIIVKENLNPLSGVEYDLKDSKNEGIAYTFTFITSPEINIEALKKIKVKKDSVEVKEEEVDSVIRNMIKQTLSKEKLLELLNPKKLEVVEGAKISDAKKKADEEIPEKFNITDEIVSEVAYEKEKTLSGLREKVQKTLKEIKEEQLEQEYAGKVLSEAVKIIEFEIPKDFVEKEIARKEEIFLKRLQTIKMDKDSYLRTQNLKWEDVKASWEKEAEQEIRSDLIVINIAVKEKPYPTKEEVTLEIEKIENPKIKAQYNTTQGIEYLRTMMVREKGIKRLLELTEK